MSKTLLSIMAVSILMVGFLTYRAFQNPSFPGPSSNQQNTSLTDNSASTPDFKLWHQFKAPSNQFVVQIPTLPQHATDKIIDNKTKEPRQYDMFVAEEDNGTLFMISVITMMPGTKAVFDKDLLSTVMNDMLISTPQGKLKHMELGTYKEYPAIDFSIENGQVIIDGKVFLVGQTLYALTSVAKKEMYQKQKFDFFINSFQLTKQQ